MSESKLRVMIADDHTMIRKGLKFLLELEVDIEVVAEASSGEQAIILAREHRPSEIVMDITMPEINGIDATRRILFEFPHIKVLFLSSNFDRAIILEALSCGAFGYLSKGGSLLTVPSILREIHRGGRFISTGGVIEGINRRN